MNRQQEINIPCPASVPRRRGDEPQVKGFDCKVNPRSPQARG